MPAPGLAVLPAAIVLGALASLAAGQTGAGGLDSPAAEQARPSLIAEVTSIAPGQTVLIGVTFDIQPGWHTYWHGRNDTVPGPWFEFSAPEGFEIGPMQWPAPQRYIGPSDLLDHIYERQVTLLAPLTAPAAIDSDAADSVSITAKVNWTVCSDICLMADATLELSLPISETAGAPSREAPRFAATRKRLPRALRPGDGITTTRTGELVEIRAPGATRLAFYPHEKGPALDNLLRDGETRGDTLNLRLDPSGSAADEPLSGLLEIWRERHDETQLIELRITAGGRAEPVEQPALPPVPQTPADGA